MSTDAGEDNSRPIALHSEGWDTLPDGRQQLKIRCQSTVDFATLPRQLKMRDDVFWKRGWDKDLGVAFYRTGDLEDLDGPGEQPYLTE